MGYVLAVALLTWGGVFFYLLRLEKMARAGRRTERGLLRNPRWELAWYVGSLNKRPRNTA